MPAIGITGGIATGKSTLVRCLAEVLGEVTIFNADEYARELVQADPDVRKEIGAEFGHAIFSGAGELNRAELRAIVFASAERRGALEKILHPRIRRRWSAQAKTFAKSPDYFFADIPLLYETGGETLCHRTVVVACSHEVQLERLLRRWGRAGGVSAGPGSAGDATGRDRNEAQQIIESQMPLAEKMKRADHVVWNNGGIEVLQEQAQLLVSLWQTQS